MIVSGIKGLIWLTTGPCFKMTLRVNPDHYFSIHSTCQKLMYGCSRLCRFVFIHSGFYKLVSGCYIYEIGAKWGRGWTQGVGPPHRTVKAFSLPCHCRSEGVSTLASFILGTFTSILDNRTEQHRPAGRKRSSGTSFPQDVAWSMRRSKGEKVNQCTVRRNKRHNVMSN